MDGNAWRQERARTTSPPQPFVPDCPSAWLVVDWSIRRPEPIPSRPPPSRAPPVFFSPFFPQGHSMPPPSPQPGLSPLSALCPFDSRHGPRPPALTTPSSPRPLAIFPLPTISTFHSRPDDLPTPSPAISTSAPSFLLRSDRLDDRTRRRVLRPIATSEAEDSEKEPLRNSLGTD